MAIPNSSSPLATGLRFLWSQDTGNTDLVSETAYTALGTALTPISTPDGNALQGNGSGYLSWGNRKDIFVPGGTAMAFAIVLQVTNSSTLDGRAMGNTVSTFGLDVQLNPFGSQVFTALIKSGDSITIPATSVANGLLSYNGKRVVLIHSWDGSNQTIWVKALDSATVSTRSLPLVYTLPNSNDPFVLMARGGASNQLNSGGALLSAMVWSRALSQQDVDSLFADPKLLFQAPDTVDPVLPGPITVTNVTQTSYDLSWPQGSDNTAYVGVDLSLNGGTTWASLGNVLSTAVTGRTPGNLDQVRVRGRDASGRTSTPLSAAVQLQHLGVLGSTILLTTGAGTHGPGLLSDSVQSGDESKRFNFTVTRRPTNGTLIEYPNGSFVYNGTADTFDYTLAVDGVAVPGPNGNGSATATMSFGATETVAPLLTSPTGAATGATTASGSVSTDEANGTLFFLTTTNATETAAAVKAGASQPVTSTGVQSILRAGLLASTAYWHHFLHRDAAGNDSTVESSAQFTTQAAGDTTAPVLTGSITLDSKTTTTITVSSPTATDAVGVASYRWSSDGGTTYVTSTQTHTFTGLTADTAYAIRVVARDVAGNDSTPALALSVTTNAIADTTAPTLTSPAASALGAYGGSGSVVTNEANGVLYWLTSTNTSETAAAVKAGSFTVVTVSGSQSVTSGGLTPSTGYYVHFLHRDAAGNDSTVARSALFTTSVAPVGGTGSGGMSLTINISLT